MEGKANIPRNDEDDDDDEDERPHRSILSLNDDIGGRDSRTTLASTKGHRVRGATLGGGSVRMTERNPRAYPVLLRSVESRTASVDDIM